MAHCWYEIRPSLNYDLFISLLSIFIYFIYLFITQFHLKLKTQYEQR